MKQTKTVLEYGLADFVYAIVALTKEGWDFDPDSRPDFYGRSYEALMVRVPTEAQVAKDEAEAAKLTRAEILAKARAEKAAKKAAEKAAAEGQEAPQSPEQGEGEATPAETTSEASESA